MKTSERMRKRGWKPYGFLWTKVVAGVPMVVGGPWFGLPSYYAMDSSLCWSVPGRESGNHGLAYCAQRAEALAKRLAKKRKEPT